MRTETLLSIVILTLLFGCATVEPPPEVSSITPIPYLAKDYPYADTLVKYMSLEDKIGQLMIIDGGSVSDTAKQRKVGKMLRNYRVGGMMFDPGEPQDLAEQISYYQGISFYPVWFGLKEGLFPKDLGGLMTLGAVPDDSLLYQYGKITGAYYRELGISLDLSLPVGVNAHQDPAFPAMHSRKDTVIKRSGLLLAGLLEEQFLACTTPLALPDTFPPDSNFTPPTDPRSVWDLETGELSALGALLKQGLPGIGLQGHRYAAIDSVNEIPTLSGEVNDYFLKHALKYRGLIFSPRLNDSSIVKRYDKGQAAVEALLHGADVLVFPEDPEATLQAVTEAVNKKSLPLAELDAKVRKVLQAKSWAGLDCWQPSIRTFTDRGMPLPERETRRIQRASVTLLRNEKDRLPLGTVIDLKIATLSIGTKNRTPFQQTLERYQSLNHVQWSSLPDSATSAARLKKLGWYKYVIIGVHEDQKAGKFPAWFTRQLMELDTKSRVVLVNFAHPGHLQGLDSLTCVAQAYGNSDYVQELAGQLVFGGATATGRLPLAVSDSFPLAQGLDHRKTTRLGFGLPEDVGLPGGALQKIDSIANYSVRMGVFPGCQVAVAKNGVQIYSRGFGHHSYDRRHRVRRSDLYDLASLTKVCATTLAVMRTYDQEENFKLTDKLSDHLSAVDTSNLEDILIEDILIHKAGLSAGLPIYEFMTYVDSVDTVKSRVYSNKKDSLHNVQIAENFYFAEAYHDTLMERIKKMKLPNKGHYVYSDLGFFLLKEMLEEIHDLELNKYMYREFYHPLGLRTIGYNPLRNDYAEKRLIPTERDRYWRKQTIHGYVHDPTAAMFGGVGGHAGLFSNAEDLVVLMQMLLQKGKYGGTRFISPKTVEMFTRQHPNSHRGLGWDRPNHGSSKKGLCVKDASPLTFGHTGFTGTCIWVDPEHELVYVFLSNRVHPNAKNQKINGMRVRQSIQQVIYDALDLKKMGQQAEAPIEPTPEPVM